MILEYAKWAYLELAKWAATPKGATVAATVAKQFEGRRVIPLLRLERMENGPDGCFSRLILPDGTILRAGELRWKNNASGVSCIPPEPRSGQAALYRFRLRPSPRFGVDLYGAVFVPDRFDILIHSGNFCGDVSLGKKSDVEGCIILGMVIGQLDGQQAVLRSKEAMDLFHEKMRGEDFDLEIS
jgi:hypothetical protein